MSRERFVLPLSRAGASPTLLFVLALMAYMAALGAAGLVAINGNLRASRQALAATLTLEVPADASPARLRTMMAVLHQSPGIASVRELDRTELARLLLPWLGPAAPIDDLPVPRLIELKTGPQSGLDLATLRRRLASVVPEARLEDHRAVLDGVREAAGSLAVVLAVVLAIGLALIAFATVFAVRTQLAIERAGIELAHLLGAADRVIARHFARGWLMLGWGAGIIGVGAAFFTIMALGDARSIIRLQAPLTLSGAAGWRLWGALIGVAAATGLIATAAAQTTVRRRIARLP